VGVFGLAPLGAYIQYYQERMGMPRSFTILAVVDAVMLIVTTSIAFLFAYKRKIAQHRQWMTRSYAVALVFISGRFVAGVTGWDFASIETQQAIIWSCLALSILLADVANNWMEIRALSATARTRAPSPQNLSDAAIETI
jgi:type II secretory pathway component PulM